jgi:hypothetical protein
VIILWVQAVLIMVVQTALLIVHTMLEVPRKRVFNDKEFMLLALKYGVPTSEVRDAINESPDEFVRYKMDFLNPDRWENRFANLICFIEKPFGYIFIFVLCAQLALPVLVLTGHATGLHAVLAGWLVTAGICAFVAAFFVSEHLTYAICGRFPFSRADGQKFATAMWNDYVEIKNRRGETIDWVPTEPQGN